MKQYSLKIIVLLIFIVSVHQLLGCSCARKPSILDSWNAHDQIFIGRVISIDTANSYDVNGRPFFRYTIEIRESFKGEKYSASNKRTIYSISFMGACNSHFELNKVYLVYASSYIRFLESSSCSRTEELSRVSSSEIEKLRELKKGFKPSNIDVKIHSLCSPIERALVTAQKQNIELNKINKILYISLVILFILLVIVSLKHFIRKKQTLKNQV